jgi:hypothetical protein
MAQQRTMGRRTFLAGAAAAAAVPAFAAKASVAIGIGETALATMPPDFNGLSYESTQLYNPDYFAASNTALVKTFRALSKNGVLRLGGSLSDVSRWKSEAGDLASPEDAAGIEKGKTERWEWKLTDPKVRDHRDGAITPASLAKLRGFCDATGWRVIYGFNLRSGSPARARDEGAHVARALGDKLLAFQVGNESDLFGLYRKGDAKTGDVEMYRAAYDAFVKAVRQAVPHAPFAGPDTASNMAWTDVFAKTYGKELVFLSSHLYAMGPGTDPTQNAELLLSGKSRLGEQIRQAKQATGDAGGVPFRLTEVNSCFRGGRPGVSDAFASALWAADMMLKTAAAGYAGVNLHGGGDGYYTPIAVTPDGGVELRPLYFGMQFAESFAGAQFVDCEAASSANVTAFAARRGKEKLLALINKGGDGVEIAQKWLKPRKALRLTAPGIEAKTGVVLKRAPVTAALPAFSALVLTGV